MVEEVRDNFVLCLPAKIVESSVGLRQSRCQNGGSCSVSGGVAGVGAREWGYPCAVLLRDSGFYSMCVSGQ